MIKYISCNNLGSGGKTLSDIMTFIDLTALTEHVSLYLVEKCSLIKSKTFNVDSGNQCSPKMKVLYGRKKA